MNNSCYIGSDYHNNSDYAFVINYRHNKYIYNEKECVFEPIKLDLTKYKNREIHDIFGKGLNDVFDYNYLLNKFGTNVLNLKSKSFFRTFLEQLFHPFYIYQIVSIAIWIRTGYYSFCLVVICLMAIILIINTFQNHKNSKNIFYYSNTGVTTIIRSLKQDEGEYDISHKSNLYIIMI